MKNKVIIIGINHFNTLGLIRSFGVNGIYPHVILVNPSDINNNYCIKSRYVRGYNIVKSDDDAIKVLLEQFYDDYQKPVLVPSSDGAIYTIDTHHNLLAEKYIIPHINHKQGEIARLMNKADQMLWAKEMGIPTAETYLIDLYNEKWQTTEYPMPCIVKPVLSHEGNKEDIKRCETRDELYIHIKHLKDKGYFRVLLQKFIIKDYEMELFGTIMENRKEIPYILTKHLREWPEVGGSVCFHEFILDKELHRQAKTILEKIQNYGFVGNFDIEIIYKDNVIYLNEINFRNSGDIYACFYNKIYYSYYSYLDMIGELDFPINLHYKNVYYAMCEDRDFKWVREGMISFKEWLKLFFKTKDFAYFSWLDLPGTYAYYKKYNIISLLIKTIKHRWVKR